MVFTELELFYEQKPSMKSSSVLTCCSIDPTYLFAKKYADRLDWPTLFRSGNASEQILDLYPEERDRDFEYGMALAYSVNTSLDRLLKERDSLKKLIFHNPSITESWVEQHFPIEVYYPWYGLLVKHKNFSEQFFINNLPRLPRSQTSGLISNLCQFSNFSPNFFTWLIEQYSDLIIWHQLSHNQSLTEDFVRRYQSKLDIESLSYNMSLSEQFWREQLPMFADKIIWSALASNQNLSIQFLEPYFDKLGTRGRDNLACNSNIPCEFFDRKISQGVKFDWVCLSSNSGLEPWFLQKYFDQFDFTMLMTNPAATEQFVRDKFSAILSELRNSLDCFFRNPNLSEQFYDQLMFELAPDNFYLDIKYLLKNPRVSDRVLECFDEQHYLLFRNLQGSVYRQYRNSLETILEHYNHYPASNTIRYLF